MDNNHVVYKTIETFAKEEKLTNTLNALPLVKSILIKQERAVEFTYKRALEEHEAYYRHCLLVAEMIIDLHFPLEKSELDLALSAALLHVLVEVIDIPEKEEEDKLFKDVDDEVYEIVKLITRKDTMKKSEWDNFYHNIRENKIALLVRLADRSNLVEGLFKISAREAREYCRETRSFFFPMCIYAKEKYPELLGPISVLMEKMRCLIEVAEVLSTKYQIREDSLNDQILSLTEENARLRMMIVQLKKERKMEEEAGLHSY